MIELYYWPTPNGHKIALFLEEAGLPYRIEPVNIAKGDQFAPDFLVFSPNNKMPAIIDRAPAGGGDPQPVFESGAILRYLAAKTGRFGGADPRQRIEVDEWLAWQMAGLGPMLGQNHHFSRYAPEPIPYAIERYLNETRRLYGVLDRRLRERHYIVDDYSIADMAAYPWIVPHEDQGIELDEFPAVRDWFERIGAREATQRAYALAEQYQGDTSSPEAKRILFGQR